MKIGARYTLYSLLASAIPMGLVVLSLYGFTRHELNSIRVSETARQRKMVESYISLLEGDVGSKINALAGDAEWIRLLLSKNASGQIDQLSLIDKAASERDRLGFSHIEIISPDSVLLARSGDYYDIGGKIDRPGLGAGVEQTISGLAVIRIGTSQTLVMLASHSIVYRGGIIGFIQGGLPLEQAFVNRLSELTGSSFELVTGKHIWRSADVGDSSSAGYDATESGTIVLPITTIQGNVGASLTIRMPVSVAAHALTSSLRLYALVALAGVMLSGGMGYVFARRLTVPLSELVGAAEEISRGEFHRRIVWIARDELGTLVEGFNSMYDRLKRSQEKLVQSEKIAAWNQMARKVAHEIRNPLTPIQVSVEDMKRSYDSNSPEFESILNNAVDTIASEIARLKRLTDEFSEFARLPAPKPEPRDLRPLIGDALRIYADQIRSGGLRVKFPQEEVRASVDGDLFTQALLNLAKNGFEAAGPSGHVSVTLEKGQRIARVVVDDDGPGVPDDLQEKLFTPHFTTKQQGSGLGLVIAHRICFDHGGRLKYEKTDNGARFVIVLPLHGGSE